MRISKKTFRIGTLTQTLANQGVLAEPSAIRFWEKEFSIKPKRSKKGHRFYTQEDIDHFILIHDLLHKKKYTIAGAKQFLNKQKFSPAAKDQSGQLQAEKSETNPHQLLAIIKDHLVQIRSLL